jgi:hypothetical protein
MRWTIMQSLDCDRTSEVLVSVPTPRHKQPEFTFKLDIMDSEYRCFTYYRELQCTHQPRYEVLCAVDIYITRISAARYLLRSFDTLSRIAVDHHP